MLGLALGGVLVTTMVACQAAPVACEVEGKSYAIGARFLEPSGCNACTCRLVAGRATAVCQTKFCSSTRRASARVDVDEAVQVDDERGSEDGAGRLGTELALPDGVRVAGEATRESVQPAAPEAEEDRRPTPVFVTPPEASVPASVEDEQGGRAQVEPLERR